jgi:dUTP pyrophosphatase
LTFFVNYAKFSEKSHFNREDTKLADIKVKYKNTDSYRLKVIPEGDWIDLAVDEDVSLKAFEFKLVELGIAMQLPLYFEANIVPRSSTFIKYGILQANSFGVIDQSYSGDNDWWKFPALAIRDTFVPRGTRICQFKLVRTQLSNVWLNDLRFNEADVFNSVSRGGFGSTGN